MFIRHRVGDYAAWRAAYEQFEGERKAGGVTGQQVFRTTGDPLDLTVLHEFGSLAQAQAFAGSDKLRVAMGSAGVIGKPEIWFTDAA